MNTPSSLAFSIIDGVERRAVERANQGLPTERRAEIASYIDLELAPVRAAIKDLALAAAFCAEHRARRTEVVPPFMGFEEHTVIHDLGPTEDAARCQGAIDKARPVMEAFGLHLKQPPLPGPHSTIIR